jgi:hypothetical protein
LGQVLLASAEGEIQKTVVAREGVVGEVAWSPDGVGVAFTFKEASGEQLYEWTVQTDSVRALAQVACAHLSWAPGPRVACRTPDAANFVMIDPRTGVPESLLRAVDQAPVYSAQSSHRGDRIAVYYSGKIHKRISGLAVVLLADPFVKIVAEAGPAHLNPIGWSADDAVIYALSASGELLAIRSDGTSSRIMGTLGKLPSPSPFVSGHAVEAGGKLKLVFSIPEDHGDIWVIDNFDGGRH